MGRPTPRDQVRPGRRLVAVAALGAAVLLVAGAALAWTKYRADVATERHELLRDARTGAAEVDRALGDHLDLLEALAAGGSFRDADPAAVTADLGALPGDAFGLDAGTVWLGPGGTAIDGRGRVRLIPGAEDEWIQQVRTSGRPAVGGPTVATPLAGADIVLAVPTGSGPDTAGVLIGGLEPGWFDELTAAEDLGDAEVAIVDRADRLIIGGEDEPDGQTDLVASASAGTTAIVWSPDTPPSAVLEAVVGFDGRRDRLVAYAEVPTADWRLVVETSVDDAYRPARRQLSLELVGLVVLAGVGLAPAVLVGRNVDRLALDQRQSRVDAERAASRERLLQRATGALATASAPADVMRAVRLGLTPLNPREVQLGHGGEPGELVVERSVLDFPMTTVVLSPDAELPGPAVVRDGRARWFESIAAARDEFPTWPDEADDAPTDGGDSSGAGAAGRVVRRHASWWLPLASPDGERFGFLALRFDPGAELTLPDRQLAGNVALQAARSLHRSRVQAAGAAELRRARALQGLYGAAAALAPALDLAEAAGVVVAQARAVLGAQDALVALLDEDGVLETAASTEPVSSSAADDEALADAVRRGVAVVLPDAASAAARYPWRARSARPLGVAAAPLRVEGRVIGGLRVGFPPDQGPDEDLAPLFAAFTDLAAQAIDRGRLYQGERQRRQRAERMQGAFASLTGTSTALDVARAAVGVGLLSLGAVSGTLTVIEPQDPEHLRMLEHRGFSNPVIRRHLRIPLSAPTPLATAARTGEPVYVTSPAELRARFPDIAPDAESSDRTAWASLPLRTAGRTFGVLGFGFTRTHRFGVEERVALEDFAARCAEALARAERFEAEHDAAVELQRALLPPTLEVPPGLRAAARYQPGVDGLMVGGDWYDLSVLEDGRVACSVGDVVGRGVAAAAAMGQLRTAVRALSPFAGPAGVLGRLEHLSSSIPNSHLATVAQLVLDPATGRLTYSLAGHLPPLLRRADGRVERLDKGRGTPLAPSLHRPRTEVTVTMERGGLLVLYTDGLVERRDRSIDVGLDRLARSVAIHGTLDVEACCDAILADLLETGSARDDVALLCVELLADP